MAQGVFEQFITFRVPGNFCLKPGLQGSSVLPYLQPPMRPEAEPPFQRSMLILSIFRVASLPCWGEILTF